MNHPQITQITQMLLSSLSHIDSSNDGALTGGAAQPRLRRV